MKNFGKTFINNFFGNELNFKVKVFNVLGIAGCLVSLIATVVDLCIGEGIENLIINLSAAFFSFILIYYASKTGKYVHGYIITIVAIFIVGFPIMFFVSSGYNGAMTYFFIFAVVFTVFMLDDLRGLIFATVEIVFYIGMCIFTYVYPQFISPFTDESQSLISKIFGFATVSVILGITMFIQFRMYNLQSKELQKEREKAEELSNAKSIFMANMSHEIRTPINVILGMNEMILRESESEIVKEYGYNVQTAGRSLLMLINNVLDVSKIESGKMILFEEPYELEELIYDLYALGKEQSSKKDIEFILKVDKNLPVMLDGDYIHIKQVVTNFISNAVKYTEQGKVELSFFAKQYDRNNEILLCISVCDTGIGIKEEDKDSLFNAFTRADLQNNKTIEGTGLGLAIAKELTVLMNGKIYMESQWEKGSIFSVEIPQKIKDHSNIGKIDLAKHTIKTNYNRSSFIAPNGKILIVDDNKENLNVIKALLSRTMLKIDLVESGPQCIEILNDNNYDLILMDYMMPGMDGMETFHKIYKIYPEFKTPIVALTANVISGTEEMFLNAGFSGYLSKPIMMEDLEDIIISCLPNKIFLSDSKGESIDSGLLYKLKQEMKQNNVKMDIGLTYLGGNISYYIKISELFIENYNSSKEKVAELIQAQNISDLSYIIHSLKSQSKAVGAMDLHNLSKIIEKRCIDLDTEYILCSMPVLLIEWERVVLSLNSFIKEIKTENYLNNNNQVMVPEQSIHEIKNNLLVNLQNYKLKDAQSEIEMIINYNKNNELNEQLKDINNFIDDLNFDEAEQILINIFDQI